MVFPSESVFEAAKKTQFEDRMRPAKLEHEAEVHRSEVSTEALVRLAKAQEAALALYREETANTRKEARAAAVRSIVSLVIAALSLLASFVFSVLAMICS